MAQVLGLADNNVKEAILNMIKDLKGNITSINEKIGNLGR